MSATLVSVWGEMRKGFLVTWAYKTNTLIGLLTLGLIFVGVAFFAQGGQMTPAYLAATLLGYVVWMYTALAVSDLSGGLSAEMHAGTLEQMAMSPTPLSLVLLGRVLANLAVTTVQVILMTLALCGVLGLSVPVRWQAVPILAVTWLGILGFGYVVAGMMLVFKQIASIISLFNNALAFLNGSFLPVDAMPAWLSLVARTLPSTQGVIVLRKVVLEELSLTAAWQSGALPRLLGHSVLYLIAGLIVFRVCERRALRRGTLGQY